jgi:hypothetical protein
MLKGELADGVWAEAGEPYAASAAIMTVTQNPGPGTNNT